MEEGSLPATWALATIGDVAAYVQRGKSPKYATCSELPVINQKCIRWHGIEKEFVKFVHDDQIPQWDEVRHLRRGDLLWNSTGTGTIGRACLYRDEFPKAVVDSHITIVRADQRVIFPGFLQFFVMSPLVQENFEEMQSGSTNQVELSRNAVLEKELPLPPLNEQRRIVEKIETLFARLDKGEEALRHVQKLLARYRQSVLKAAVTGQLTAHWRAENAHRLEPGQDLLARILQTRRETWTGRGKYKEPTAPDTTDLPELPEGWVWASVEQLANVMGGLTKNKKREEMPLRKPMLRVANVYQNRLELDDIHLTGITESECARVLLEELDLLVVEG